MQYGIIIAVVIYELVVILGVSAVLRKEGSDALEKKVDLRLQEEAWALRYCPQPSL